MKFSSDSKILMEQFLDNFKQYNSKLSPSQQKNIDEIKKELYFDIHKSFNDVSTIKLEKNIVTIKTKHNITNVANIDSRFIPKYINRYILEHACYEIQYKIPLGSRIINIYFVLLNNTDINNIDKYDTYVTYMLTWLKMLNLYSIKECSNILNIHIIPTPFNKRLPGNSFQILGPEHCNSAYTNVCNPVGNITIFRKEEWFKVFIHETFHSYGLDFSQINISHLKRKINAIFKIESSFEIYEAYSEFWATIINCLFCSYYLIDNKSNVEEFLVYSDFCITYERIFSLYQCIKILDFMGLSYDNLYGNDTISNSIRKYLYKEKTNVFSYYILKLIFLYNYNFFLQWCKKNNVNLVRFFSTSTNIDSLMRFISINYKNTPFLLDLNKMKEQYKIERHNNSNFKVNMLNKTTRMTICEMF